VPRSPTVPIPACSIGSNTEETETLTLSVTAKDSIGQTATGSVGTVVYRHHVENDCGEVLCHKAARH
jgi:hypothetical protein